MTIAGSIVLVTGANRGLGLAFCEELLAMGAEKVYAAARSPISYEDSRIVPIKLDVTSTDDIQRLTELIPDVNMLINNAGIREEVKFFDELTVEVVERLLNTNLISILRVSREVARIISSNGGGAIANVLSAMSWVNTPGSLAYSVSKAAAYSLSESMRIELAPYKIQVSAILVGMIDTDMMKNYNMPKMSPKDVAIGSLTGIEEGLAEVILDSMARKAKLRLSEEKPKYQETI